MSAPAQFERCARITQPGARCVFGVTDDGGLGIWAVSGGAPLATWPAGAQGLQAASAQFRAWEQPSSNGHGGLIATVITLGVLVALIVIYLVLHAHKYQNCIFTPGIFDWPSTCL